MRLNQGMIMDFMYLFDVDDIESRHDYIRDYYNNLKKLEPDNPLLKFVATVTSSELYWNTSHAEEFHKKFCEPQYISNLRANLDLNYGIALYDEINRITQKNNKRDIAGNLFQTLGIVGGEVMCTTVDELLDVPCRDKNGDMILPKDIRALIKDINNN